MASSAFIMSGQLSGRLQFFSHSGRGPYSGAAASHKLRYASTLRAATSPLARMIDAGDRAAKAFNDCVNVQASLSSTMIARSYNYRAVLWINLNRYA